MSDWIELIEKSASPIFLQRFVSTPSRQAFLLDHSGSIELVRPNGEPFRPGFLRTWRLRAVGFLRRLPQAHGVHIPNVLTNDDVRHEVTVSITVAVRRKKGDLTGASNSGDVDVDIVRRLLWDVEEQGRQVTRAVTYAAQAMYHDVSSEEAPRRGTDPKWQNDFCKAANEKLTDCAFEVLDTVVEKLHANDEDLAVMAETKTKLRRARSIDELRREAADEESSAVRARKQHDGESEIELKKKLVKDLNLEGWMVGVDPRIVSEFLRAVTAQDMQRMQNSFLRAERSTLGSLVAALVKERTGLEINIGELPAATSEVPTSRVQDGEGTTAGSDSTAGDDAHPEA